MRPRIVAALALLLATGGCGSRYGVSGPDDVGVAARYSAAPTQIITIPAVIDPGDPNKKITRNQILSQWIIKSDSTCSDYQLQLSRAIRDARLGTDVLATALSGLATIFANPAVTHPLSGAATIALGVGGDIQSDLFLQQAGDVVSTAIQAIRTRARTELQKKWTAEYADYTLEQGLIDVQRYDRETCNLNVALNEIRASLNIAGPLTPQANNPIIPLTPDSIAAGAPLQDVTVGMATPVTTITVPPTLQRMPDGQVVFTPGKIMSAPAVMPQAVAPVVSPSAPTPKRRAGRLAPRPSSGVIPSRSTPPVIPPAVPPQTSAESEFLATASKLPTDANGALTPESRRILDACTGRLGIPPNTLLSDIRRMAGLNLPSITACIAKP
jgi:hypothetical protein